MGSKKSIEELDRITALLSTRKGMTFYQLVKSIKRSNRTQVIMRQLKIVSLFGNRF
jgi:hypothetical protein